MLDKKIAALPAEKAGGLHEIFPEFLKQFGTKEKQCHLIGFEPIITHGIRLQVVNMSKFVVAFKP